MPVVTQQIMNVCMYLFQRDMIEKKTIDGEDVKVNVISDGTKFKLRANEDMRNLKS